eukprot:1266692-Rhodomonas_salina.1
MPLVQLAMRLKYQHYSMLNLSAWAFDIMWGTAGDVSPLGMYTGNSTGESVDDAFLASSHRQYAYVRVEPDNSLTLWVGTFEEPADGGEVLCGEARRLVLRKGPNCDRFEQESQVFGHRWGPAPHYRRCGLVLSCNDEEPIQTLVPFDVPDEDGVVKNGFAGLEFYRQGCYLSSDGFTTKRLRGDSIEDRVLPYGDRIAVRTSSDVVKPYADEGKLQGFLPGVSEEDVRSEWLLGRVVCADTLMPEFGKLTVAVQYQTGHGESTTVTITAPPNDLKIFEREGEWDGCRQGFTDVGAVTDAPLPR